MVGTLDEELTFTYNALTQPFKGTTFPINDVEFNGQNTNYLLTVIRCTPKVKLKATTNDLKLDIKLNLYCKIADHSADGSDQAFSKNAPLPIEVSQRAEQFFKDNVEKLIQAEKDTGCDFLRIKEKLYRFNHKEYSRYKDYYLSQLENSISVTVRGQR
jgi:hypothetical protein